MTEGKVMQSRQTKNLQRLVLESHQRQNLPLTFTPAQHHYLTKVLRLRGGDRFMGIVDRKGAWWHMEITPDLQGAILLEELENLRDLPICTQLAIALPKGNSMEAIIPAVTELGVSIIQPLFADRSVVKTAPSAQKMHRWQKLAIEASELSLRSKIPEIKEPIPFATFISQDTSTYKYLAVTTADSPHFLDRLLQDYHDSPAEISITMSIGCEGGWTASEMNYAHTHQFQPISLGQRILSALTAPVVALSILNALVESDKINRGE